MTWFKVDDKLWGHPKWLATPPGARALWVTAGSWSAAHGTDGAIIEPLLRQFGARRRDADALVSAGLWRRTVAGWQFHDWDIFQPDSASTRAKEGARKAAGSLGNHQRWHVGRGVRVPSCEHCQAPGP